jgi:hypothetical protein
MADHELTCLAARSVPSIYGRGVSDDVFPDRSMTERDKLSWMIETNGYAVVPVGPRNDLDPPLAGYSHTVGLTTAFDFPEVVVFGLQPVAASGVLGDLVGVLRDGVAPPVGAIFTGLFDSDLRCALVEVDLALYAGLFGTAHRWFTTTEVPMVQLLWPDRNGFLPTEAGYEQRLRFTQPVLGTLID